MQFQLNHFAIQHVNFVIVKAKLAMSNARNLSFSSSRQNSLSSLSSSMESLSSSQRDSYCSIEHEWAPCTSFTIPRLRTKTSDYDTGFSATEYDDGKKQTKKVSGRVRKVRLRALTLQGWVRVLSIALLVGFLFRIHPCA